MRLKRLFKIILIFCCCFVICNEAVATNPKKIKKNSTVKTSSVKGSTKLAKTKKAKKNKKAKQKPVIEEVPLIEEVKSEPLTARVDPVVSFNLNGLPQLENLQALTYLNPVENFIKDQQGNKVFISIEADLQAKARSLLKSNSIPWGAIVAIEPKTGKVKTLVGYSNRESSGEEVAIRATYPAASLFKLITASAAIEQRGLTGDDTIYFRGGNYSLEKYNYSPNPKLDRRKISFADALGKSVNPAFARVALNNLSTTALQRYAQNYSFNFDIPFDTQLETSHFQSPRDDYELARTAAGFGPVFVSPLHAALITATIANKGVMMRPYFIERIIDPTGKMKYQIENTPLRVSILGSTAKELIQMMETTTETGTAKKHFIKLRNPFLNNSEIASKTGTLSGNNPKGMYTWFVAAVPAKDPEIAIAALVINPGGAKAKASYLGKEFLEYFFRNRDVSLGKTLQTKQFKNLRAKS